MATPTLRIATASRRDKGEDVMVCQAEAQLPSPLGGGEREAWDWRRGGRAHTPKGQNSCSLRRGPSPPLDSSHSDPTPVALFAVFDGHGGKAASAAAGKLIVAELASALASAPAVAAAEAAAPATASLHPLAASLSNGDAPPPGVPPSRTAAWAAADALAAALPAAAAAAFETLHTRLRSDGLRCGTTATLVAIIDGWRVVTANVGDSLAVLDTGSEVVTLTPSHRLEDAPAEVARVTAAGASVGPADVNGVPAGPPRVWPGGLAMSRSLCDPDSHAAVLATPDVRAATLPPRGGRIVLASDGLWDAVSTRAAAHRARGLPATRAAADLVHMALRSRGLRDDVSVAVIDIIPPDSAASGARLPPCLAKAAGALDRRPSGASGATVNGVPSTVLHRPLDEASAAAWLADGCARRAEVVAAAAEIDADAEEAAAVAAVLAAAASSSSEEEEEEDDEDEWEAVAPRRRAGRAASDETTPTPPDATPTPDSMPSTPRVILDGAAAAAVVAAPLVQAGTGRGRGRGRRRGGVARPAPSKPPSRKHPLPTPSPTTAATSPPMPRATKGARPGTAGRGRGRGRRAGVDGCGGAAVDPAVAPVPVPAAGTDTQPPPPPAGDRSGGRGRGRGAGRGRGRGAAPRPVPDAAPPSPPGLIFGSFSPPPPPGLVMVAPPVEAAAPPADGEKPRRRNRPPPHMRRHFKGKQGEAAAETA